MAQRRLAKRGEQIRARYTRSNYTRVIHVDGAYGGPTNGFLIHMAVFSEHRTSAENVLLTAAADGSIRETSMDDKDVQPVFIREIEADLVMTPNTARAIRDWLSERIDELEGAVSQLRRAQEEQARGE